MLSFKDALNDLQTNDQKEALLFSTVGSLLADSKYDDALALLSDLQSTWDTLSTARLTKILKRIFDSVSIETENYEGIIRILSGLIATLSEKKLLKCELECKLIYVYLVVGMYKECLDLIKEVTTLLKKYEDSLNLIRVFLYESRAYYALRNLNMAKSALTAARALAVGVACPPGLQAEIDLMNGMFLVDEKCYDSATGYFVESIEGYSMETGMKSSTSKDRTPESGTSNTHNTLCDAVVPLRYLVLSKLLAKKFNEVASIFQSKYVTKWYVSKNISSSSDDVTALLMDVIDVAKQRDVVQYKQLLNDNASLLHSDQFIYKHLNFYYNRLLDQNILKIIEPYSHVKISYIAEKLQFEESIVEDKLRMMILDKEISGILDHKTQCLVLYETEEREETELERSIRVMVEYTKN